MEQPGVVAGNFALSFSLNVLSIFVHISGCTGPITLIWASLERCFPPAEVETDTVALLVIFLAKVDHYLSAWQV